MPALNDSVEPSQQPSGHLFGTPVVRREDERFLRGGGQYIANLDIPGAAWVTFVTSTAAHARLRSVDVEAARHVPGIVAVVTSADLDIGPYPAADPTYPD